MDRNLIELVLIFYNILSAKEEKLGGSLNLKFGMWLGKIQTNDLQFRACLLMHHIYACFLMGKVISLKSLKQCEKCIP